MKTLFVFAAVLAIAAGFLTAFGMSQQYLQDQVSDTAAVMKPAITSVLVVTSASEVVGVLQPRMAALASVLVVASAAAAEAIVRLQARLVILQLSTIT